MQNHLDKCFFSDQQDWSQGFVWMIHCSFPTSFTFQQSWSRFDRHITSAQGPVILCPNLGDRWLLRARGVDLKIRQSLTGAMCSGGKNGQADGIYSQLVQGGVFLGWSDRIWHRPTLWVREERDLGVSAHGQSGNTGTSGSDESIRDDCLH